MPACGKEAAYRTVGGPLLGFYCLKHMELALEYGMNPEQMISLPSRRSA